MIFFEDSVLCTLTGADPGGSLQAISQQGIILSNVQWEGELTVRFRCSRRSRKTIEIICGKRGDEVRFSREQGIGCLFRKMLNRPVLAAGFLLFLGLTLMLPTRVLFFQVEGNEIIPDRQILAAAEDCGIRFGVSRRQVRSEKMKNALLAAMPELKWAGINTAGCTAVISVREREAEPERGTAVGVSSIAACRDGYITSCTATKGNLLCAPGQIVQEGQVLISGYTDCGICIRVTEAQGEVFAQTRRDQTTKTPFFYEVRLTEKALLKRFSLILGKKRINFWKGSGIYGGTCGRMYEEYYITLPGGFRLPVSLGVETLTEWETAQKPVPQDLWESAMKDYARNTVLRDMVAGKILGEVHVLTNQDDGCVLTSRFLCEEMIGRVITEEIGETNGKAN